MQYTETLEGSHNTTLWDKAVMAKTAREATRLQSLLTSGDWSGALALAEKLINRLNGHYPNGDHFIVRLYLVMAYGLIQRKRYSKAYEILLMIGRTLDVWLSTGVLDTLGGINVLLNILSLADIGFLAAYCQHYIGNQSLSCTLLKESLFQRLPLLRELVSSYEDSVVVSLRSHLILSSIEFDNGPTITIEAEVGKLMSESDSEEFQRLGLAFVAIRKAILNNDSDYWRPYLDLASFYSRVGKQTESSKCAFTILKEDEIIRQFSSNDAFILRVMNLLTERRVAGSLQDSGVSDITNMELNKYDRDASRYSPLNHLIFISSTFKDMQTERDMLQLDLLPRLRQVCADHGENIEMIDLRWGISTPGLNHDDRIKKIVQSCLAEVKRCRPHIICLLGNRYGTVLEEGKWSTSLADKELAELGLAISRCDGIDFTCLSLTAAEILYGTSPEMQYAPKPIVCQRVNDVLGRGNGESTIQAGAIYQDSQKLHNLLDYMNRLPGTMTIRYEAVPSENPRRAYGMRCVDIDMSLSEQLYTLVLEDVSKNWAGESNLGPFDKMWSRNEHFSAERVNRSLPLDDVQAEIDAALLLNRSTICIQESEGNARTNALAILYRRLLNAKRPTVSLFPDAIGECTAGQAAAFIAIGLRLALGLEPVPADGLPVSGNSKEWASCYKHTLKEWQVTHLDGPVSSDLKKEGTIKPFLVFGATNSTAVQESYIDNGFHGKHAKREHQAVEPCKERTVVIIDSIFDIDGLYEIVEDCSVELNELPITFVLSCRTEERVYEDGVTIDISCTKGSAISNYVERRCNAAGRSLPDIAKKALSEKVEYKSFAFAELMFSLINSIDAGVLGHTRSKDLDSAIAREIRSAPNDTVGLCWRLQGSVSDSVGGQFTDALVYSLAFGCRGLTKDELQDVFDYLNIQWVELSFAQCRSGLSAIINESADGSLSLGIQSYRNSVIDLCPCRDKVCQGVLLASLCRGLWTSRQIENALRTALICKYNDLCLRLIVVLTTVKYRNEQLVKDAVLHICSEDNGVSISLLLDWLTNLIENSDSGQGGQAKQARDSAILTTRFSVGEFFVHLILDMGIRGNASDRIVSEVGSSLLRLCAAIRSGRVLGSFLLVNEKIIKKLEKKVKNAEYRANPGRWSEVIVPNLDYSPQKTVSIQGAGVIASMIGDSYRWNKYLLDGIECYDMDSISNWTPKAINDAVFVGYGDAGITYILANGYPYVQPYENNSEACIYATQGALWVYLSKMGCSPPLSNDFLYKSTDKSNIRKAMFALVDGAMEAKRRSSAESKGVVMISGIQYCTKVYSSRSVRVSSMLAVLEPLLDGDSS